MIIIIVAVSGDVILHSDLRWTGDENRSVMRSIRAYIEMKSLAWSDRSIDRLHWGLSRATSSGLLLCLIVISIAGRVPPLHCVSNFDSRIEVYQAHSLFRLNSRGAVPCCAMKRYVGLWSVETLISNEIRKIVLSIFTIKIYPMYSRFYFDTSSQEIMETSVNVRENEISPGLILYFQSRLEWWIRKLEC